MPSLWILLAGLWAVYIVVTVWMMSRLRTRRARRYRDPRKLGMDHWT